MNILKVGYLDILLPDNVDAGKLMTALSKGVPCNRYYSHEKAVTVREEPLELGLQHVPRGTKIIRKEGEAVVSDDVIYAPAPKRLRLNAPKQQRDFGL